MSPVNEPNYIVPVDALRRFVVVLVGKEGKEGPPASDRVAEEELCCQPP